MVQAMVHVTINEVGPVPQNCAAVYFLKFIARFSTQTQEKTTATMVYRPCLIHHGRSPSTAAAAARGATNLISGLGETFCGSAVVVGGSGAE